MTMAVLTYPHFSLADEQSPVTVYTGGPIFTMNQQNEMAEAIAVQKDIIIGVGTKSDMLALAGKNVHLVDLKGKTLLPGLIDGHSHFISGGEYDLYYVNLNVPPLGPVSCIADLQEVLRKHAANVPEGQLIYGINYNDLGMKEQRHPTCAELDAVSTKHPIVIVHVSGHAAVANTLAFKMAQVTKDSKLENCKLRLDEKGELTGIIEGGGAWVFYKLPGMPQINISLNDCIRKDCETYAANGVTLANVGESTFEYDQAMRAASENGTLKIRGVLWPYAHDKKLIDSYGKLRSGDILDKKGLVILGAAKMYADGSPQGYTALFSKPYYKQMTGKPTDYRGFSYFESDEQRFGRVKELHDAGWQIATHTNGDQAIQDMLDAYGAAIKSNPRKDHRHILVHCQFNRPDQVPVIAELGLIPTYFVTHTYFWGDIHRNFVAGPEMAAHISPCKAALDKDIPFALHNDTPVTPISPLMDVYSAVNRLTSSGFLLGADQRITVTDALRAVTINAARMYFMDDKVGSLEKGKLADLTILDKNPVEVAPEAIKDIRVLETIVGGETVYKA